MAAGNNKTTSRRVPRNRPDSVGYAYVGIPPNVDRDEFVESCYRRGRITIITEQGGVFNECYITTEAIQQVVFPELSGEKGTFVVYIANEFYNKPLVIGTLPTSDLSLLLNENETRQRKVFKGVETVVQQDPKSGAIIVGITSQDPAKINIIARGNEETSINVESSGSVNVVTDKNISLKSYESTTESIVDVEKKEDTYEVKKTKESFSTHRKNEKGEVQFVVDDQAISLKRKTEGNDQEILINDDGFVVSSEEGDKKIVIDKDKIVLSIKGGDEKITIQDQLIHLETSKNVKINGGGEAITKAETLITLIGQLQAQIQLLKNAFMTGSAAAVPTDGGKAAMAAAATSVQSIINIDFDPIKSQVSLTD